MAHRAVRAMSPAAGVGGGFAGFTLNEPLARLASLHAGLDGNGTKRLAAFAVEAVFIVRIERADLSIAGFALRAASAHPISPTRATGRAFPTSQLCSSAASI